MEIIYNKYRGKKVEYPGNVEGIIVGYCDNNLIVGCDSCHPSYSFRRLDKDTFIEDEYKESKYRYFYCTEATMIKQYPEIK